MTQLDLVIPGLCGPLPEINNLESSSIQSLVLYLAKSDQKQIPQKDFYQLLAALFELGDTRPLASAALSLLSAEQYSEQGFWLHADPVHLQADMDHAILRDSRGLDLTQEEATALIEELNAHFAEDDIHFLMHDKDSWFVHTPANEKITTTPVHDVISRNVYTFMPQGEDALFWKKFMNEVQMLLYQSPVNEKRIAENKLPINGAWLWGEGVLPAKTLSQQMNVFSSQPVVKGLARLNETPCHAVDDFFEKVLHGSKNMLVLDDLFTVTAYGDVMAWQADFNDLYQRWLEPVLQFAVKKKIKLNLYPCNGVCYQVSGKNKFRFFRDKKIESYFQAYE